MKLNNNDDSHNSGLNLLIYNMLLDIESHPAWVCGLKQRNISSRRNGWNVTPCVGVWIETFIFSEQTEEREVTPCVGVWIETILRKKNCCPCLSHPAWVCGLKHFTVKDDSGSPVSHPAWVCGLKLNTLLQRHRRLQGHTLRGCVD